MQQWMNQWPVIFISFKSVDGRNFSGAYDMLRLAVAGVFKQHLYLADSDRINAYDREIFLRIAQGSASESFFELRREARRKARSRTV